MSVKRTVAILQQSFLVFIIQLFRSECHNGVFFRGAAGWDNAGNQIASPARSLCADPHGKCAGSGFYQFLDLGNFFPNIGQVSM